MGKWVKTQQPCPCGNSHDAYSIDVNGNGYCFGQCGGKFFKNENNNQQEGNLYDEQEIEYGIVSTRGLNERTLSFYNIRTKFASGEPVSIGFPWGKKGMKVQNLGGQEPKFYYSGNCSNVYLFGKELFDPGGHDSITITEGVMDAPSIYQTTGGKTAAVAVRSATTAHGDCVQEFEYINSFNKIVLCFDSDEAGKKAMDSVASMFDFRKVYVVRLTRYKDANDYIQNHEQEELYKAWSKARRYSPENIISSFSDIRQTLDEGQNERVGTYPFSGLQASLHGLHRGELVTFKALEGVGKTEVFRAIEHHLLKTEESPIGILHFEESNNDTIRGIATYELEQPAAMEGSPLSNEDVLQAYMEAVGHNEDRLFIRKSYDMDDIQNILDNVRFMIAGFGCSVVFFDHISWLAVSENVNDDERKKLDLLSQKLKLLAEELHACIVIISHINDDGQTRGSRYISKVSNTIINLYRDIANADFYERSKTYFTIEKGRGQGTKAGPAGYAYYDLNTYTLKDGNG